MAVRHRQGRQAGTSTSRSTEARNAGTEDGEDGAGDEGSSTNISNISSTSRAIVRETLAGAVEEEDGVEEAREEGRLTGSGALRRDGISD